MKFLTQLCRLLVGALFIFSGFIKANDPLGFSYKLQEYFEVLHIPFFIPFELYLSILICAFEIVLGVALLIGYRIRLTIWLLLLLIVFFTFLTFYAAYFDKVKDCGCFGDFLHLRPWQSFSKDVTLLVMILIILIGRKNIYPLFGTKIEKVLMVLTVLLCIGFPVYTYNYLPVKDFRPFAIGKNIQQGMILPLGAKCDSVEMVFIYEKDGKQIECSYNDVMKGKVDTAYKCVGRNDKVIREGDHPAIHDFSIVSQDGNDYTDKILNYPNYYFFLVMYDLDKTNKEVFGKVNDFAKLCRSDGVPIIALTASANRIESFKKETGTDIDFYLTDETTLRTMIRSNPGLMLLKKGTVVDMWHYHNFPSYSNLQKQLKNKN